MKLGQFIPYYEKKNYQNFLQKLQPATNQAKLLLENEIFEASYLY